MTIKKFTMFPCAKKPSQKCNCCEKKLKKSDREKSKRFRKRKFRQCNKCKGKVCLSCGLDNICHECMIRENITLEPDALMQTDRKTLLNYLSTLHCKDYEFQTLDCKYLVKQILTRYKVHEKWDPNTTDYSPPQLRRSKIQQEPETGQPKPQPAMRSRKMLNNISQQPERSLVDTVQDRKAPNILPLREIKNAEYFDTLSSAELKYFLQEHSVSSVNINEKPHLKRIAIELWRKHCQNQIRTSSMHQYNRSMSRVPVPKQRASRNQASNQQHQKPIHILRSPSLKNISSEQEIDRLSFDELVIILHKYSINPHYYKSTMEMANQVKMLWSNLIRRPDYQQNDLGDSSMQTQLHKSVLQSHSTGHIFHQDIPIQHDHQSNHHQNSKGPLFPNHEIPHQSLDDHRIDRNDHASVKEPVQYANFNVEAHHRGAHSGSRSMLYSEIEAMNDTPGLHLASFVPEVHHIPLQTVQIEYLPPETISLEGIDGPDEIGALSSQELVELLEQHKVQYNQQSRDNKKHLVEMVTRLWLRKKGPEAIADDVIARVRTSKSSNSISFPEMTQPITQVCTTNNALHGQVLRNKQEVSLLDITSPGDIEGLSSAQLKFILQKHKKNPTYYTERRELVLEVRLLWDREQKQKIEGKTVGKNTALMEEYYKETESLTSKTTNSLSKSGSIKQTEELRRSFFREQFPPPVPSPRASLQRGAMDKSNNEIKETELHFQEEQSLRRPVRPPTPPVRDNARALTARPEANKTAEIQMARIEPFSDRQDSIVSLSLHSPVKTYVPVYPRERDIVRSQSTCSENEMLKVQNIKHISKNVSLGDIRAPEEIQEMPVRDIRMLLEKYDVEIYPGAEKGHLIELVTKLWDKRQTQGLGLAYKNCPNRERFRSTRTKSSEVVYAEIIHVSNSSAGQANVLSIEQVHLDPGISEAKITDFLAIDLSEVQSLSDISSPEIIDKLNNRQIKSILSKHAVDFSTCTEKKEMADCLRNLWNDERNINAGDVHRHENVCCVCRRRDQLPDCVFLNCGHMIMCMDCGSKTKNCPKCRQYIVRVVRVFKS